MTRNVLVTGSSGAIGTLLCKRLESLNGVIVYKFDIKDEANNQIDYTIKYDYIFHLAANSRVSTCDMNGLKNNINVTHQVLALAKYNNCHVAFTSSWYSRYSAKNLYSMSKYYCERVLETYRKSKIYIIGNVYGCGNNLVDDLIDGKIDSIYHNYVRYFINVHKVIDCLVFDFVKDNTTFYTDRFIYGFPHSAIEINKIIIDTKLKYGKEYKIPKVEKCPDNIVENCGNLKEDFHDYQDMVDYIEEKIRTGINNV